MAAHRYENTHAYKYLGPAPPSPSIHPMAALRHDKLVALPSLSCALSSLPQATSLDSVSLHPSMYAQHAADSEAKARLSPKSSPPRSPLSSSEKSCPRPPRRPTAFRPFIPTCSRYVLPSTTSRAPDPIPAIPCRLAQFHTAIDDAQIGTCRSVLATRATHRAPVAKAKIPSLDGAPPSPFFSISTPRSPGRTIVDLALPKTPAAPPPLSLHCPYLFFSSRIPHSNASHHTRYTCIHPAIFIPWHLSLSFFSPLVLYLAPSRSLLSSLWVRPTPSARNTRRFFRFCA